MLRKIRNFITISLNRIFFKLKNIKYGNNLRAYGFIKICGCRKKLNIGDNCILRSGLRTNPLGGSKQIVIYCGNNGKISIGNNVGISNSCIRCEKSVKIEDNVLIGGDCKIYDCDMHSILFDDRMKTPDTNKKSSEIVLKNGCWIGAHSIILKGVTIGERSIVGAGSVVTKSNPNDEIWGGNPARFIIKIDNKMEN